MRVCPCGGLIDQGELTGNRDRWECRSCGRYEIKARSNPWGIIDRSTWGVVSDQDRDVLDHEIAIMVSKIRASYSDMAAKKCPPCGADGGMIPVAYAMFEFLASACDGYGIDDSWDQFLQEALSECITKHRNKPGRLALLDDKDD